MFSAKATHCALSPTMSDTIIILYDYKPKLRWRIRLTVLTLIHEECRWAERREFLNMACLALSMFSGVQALFYGPEGLF